MRGEEDVFKFGGGGVEPRTRLAALLRSAWEREDRILLVSHVEETPPPRDHGRPILECNVVPPHLLWVHRVAVCHSPVRKVVLSLPALHLDAATPEVRGFGVRVGEGEGFEEVRGDCADTLHELTAAHPAARLGEEDAVRIEVELARVLEQQSPNAGEGKALCLVVDHLCLDRVGVLRVEHRARVCDLWENAVQSERRRKLRGPYGTFLSPRAIRVLELVV